MCCALPLPALCSRSCSSSNHSRFSVSLSLPLFLWYFLSRARSQFRLPSPVLSHTARAVFRLKIARASDVRCDFGFSFFLSRSFFLASCHRLFSHSLAFLHTLTPSADLSFQNKTSERRSFSRCFRSLSVPVHNPPPLISLSLASFFASSFSFSLPRLMQKLSLLPTHHTHIHTHTHRRDIPPGSG